MRLLLLSSSRIHGTGYLDHAIEAIAAHFEGVRRVAFIPFALQDRRGYGETVAERLREIGLETATVMADASGSTTIDEAGAIFTGGGNTFRLLACLQETGMVSRVRDRVREGVPYLGTSAGSVIAAPTIRTTNDMPIVQPASFDALGLVPFQVNCHYLDADPSSTHVGETREQRIQEYLEENETPVVGLREGSWLKLDGTSLRLGGVRGARLFRRGADPTEHAPGDDLGFLMKG